MPRISFGARVFAMTALLVTLAVGAAVVVTYVYGNGVAHETARQALSRASSVQTTLQQQRQEQLKLIARVFAGDQDIVAYIAEGAGQGASILDLLEERRNDLGTTSPWPSTRRAGCWRAPTTRRRGRGLSQRPLVKRRRRV